VATAVPLVSVVLAAHDAERYLSLALESVLRQTLADLELVVVDDGSTDRTAEIVAEYADERVVGLRNEERLGLAASLNRGLDAARGRYVARLDADDVTMPWRLERQVARMQAGSQLGVVGTAALELDEHGRAGALHEMPSGRDAVRWHALFSSPFFHPSVLVDRELLDRHELRYRPEYLESEDYDLWARLLAVADGDNLAAPLVLYRSHAGQASKKRRGVQRDFQRRVALREIARVAPDLPAEAAELAWQVGAGEPVGHERLGDAVDAFSALVGAFEHGGGGGIRATAARALARAGARAPRKAGAHAVARALELDPSFPVGLVADRARRRSAAFQVRREAAAWLAELEPRSERAGAIRVAAVFPEPTPYRAPLLDRIAAHSDIDLTVIYAAETVAGRTWTVELRHPALFLRGKRVPGADRVLHHDYPLTPGVIPALERTEPEVVVVSGWSTFAAQAAIAWCRLRKTPYVLVVESHDEGPRRGWRKKVKGTVVPPVVRGAAGVLVTGTLARRSMVERGAPEERVRVFANTIDVAGFGERADRLSARRAELREELGVRAEDVVVLSVARLAPEKGHDVLVRAVASAGDSRLLLVLVGEGSERASLDGLARDLGVRLLLTGDRPWEGIVETYVAADVFALLSAREPWAVVVNEAAACGLPLLLTDRVGAAYDLLRDGENGFLVDAGDVEAAATALRRLAADPDERRRLGARSREIVQEWSYEPSVEAFIAAVHEAVGCLPQ
jgi:glycosyltransferase involved in cell wall biosynthesis/GT2 family glycosyltransferase